MIYGGWINAKEKQRNELRELGVEGKMDYNHNSECFEDCDIPNDETMIRLIRRWWKFWPNCFTAIGTDNNQMPREKQKYWSYKLTWWDYICRTAFIKIFRFHTQNLSPVSISNKRTLKIQWK